MSLKNNKYFTCSLTAKHWNILLDADNWNSSDLLCLQMNKHNLSDIAVTGRQITNAIHYFRTVILQQIQNTCSG